MRNINKKMMCLMFMICMMFVPFYGIHANAAEVIASGECGAQGDNAKWTLDKDGVLTISGNGEMKDYDMPLGLEDEDSVPWYSRHNTIKKIVISGVSKIGIYAFYKCQETEVQFMDDKLVEIADQAFDANENLQKIENLNSVEKMGECTFWGCSSLESIDLPETLTSIGAGCFYGCVGLKEVIIPGGVKTIPNDAFACVDYAHVMIKEGVERIEHNAFTGSRVELSSTVSYINNECFSNEAVIYGSNKYTQDWAYSNSKQYVDMSKSYDIDKADMQSINPDYQYTGKEICPEISQMEYTISDPKCGDTTIPLMEGVDYTVSYTNHINRGKASVVITGKGIFTGTKVIDFNIYEVLDNCNVSLEYDRILYDGKGKKPAVTVKCGNEILTKDKDYSLTYTNNIEDGTAYVTITGTGDFKGVIQKSFTIYKYDITGDNVEMSYSSTDYDGTAKTPAVVVKHDGKNLVENVDYKVEYSNNIMPGIANVRITGIGQYKGNIERQFEIVGVSLADADVALSESIYSYDGSAKTPAVTVKLKDKTLNQNVDYTLSYENNVSDGTAYAVVTGIGIYKDIVKASYVILPYNAGMDAVYPDGTMIDGNFVYGVTDDELKEVELCCPATKNLSKIQIPAYITDEQSVTYKVTSIGQKAFYKNTKITSLNVGNQIKSIEDYAFYGCKNLSTIKFGQGVELLGNSSFRKCTKLVAVTLPKSIDELGKNVFYGCKKLKTITINANSVVDVNANAIKGISQKAVIKVPNKLVKKYKKELGKNTGFKSGMKIKKK